VIRPNRERADALEAAGLRELNGRLSAQLIPASWFPPNDEEALASAIASLLQAASLGREWDSTPESTCLGYAPKPLSLTSTPSEGSSSAMAIVLSGNSDSPKKGADDPPRQLSD
jgi:hypothetical protein